MCIRDSFEILSRECPDEELAKIYRGLYASERGHYLSFLELAREVDPGAPLEERWEEMLVAEAEIIQRQPAGPRMHSWLR